MSEPNEPDGAMCYWLCPNCGQMHFSEEPPDMCDICQDFTTWQLVAVDAETSDEPAKAVRSKQPPEPKQRKLFDVD